LSQSFNPGWRISEEKEWEGIIMRKIQIITVLALAAAVSTAAISAETISNGTRKDLMAAMKDEAFSHLRYKLFAEQARKNGNTALAQQFEKVAEDELSKHFKEQAQLLGVVRTDTENLATAISDEYLETAKMYAEMAKRAEEAGDVKIALHFKAAAADESEHQKLFKTMFGKRPGAVN
jgi:rubrerythrin